MLYHKYSRKYGGSVGEQHALEDGVGNCAHDELHQNGYTLTKIQPRAAMEHLHNHGGVTAVAGKVSGTAAVSITADRGYDSSRGTVGEDAAQLDSSPPLRAATATDETCRLGFNAWSPARGSVGISRCNADGHGQTIGSKVKFAAAISLQTAKHTAVCRAQPRAGY